MTKTLRILGTRGVPASHGGFETFAERLALYLVGRGWRVVVYCQTQGSGPITTDSWRGIERRNVPVADGGPKGTIVFDWKATCDAAREGQLCLTLGYNTAVFCLLLRLRQVPNVINMDGIEWRRQKWGRWAKLWFWLNDWAGSWLGDHLVADNPGIASHLQTRVSERKISTIPYGADQLNDIDPTPVMTLGLIPKRYWTVIARPEPENSVMEIVAAFSRRRRGTRLAVLGKYDPERNSFHRSVMAAASEEVVFLGAIYDQEIVKALRFHAAGYIHGHQVGGTNPSLVEALGAGNAVIAFDNPFNRWVAGGAARYFSDEDSCATLLDLIVDNDAISESLRREAHKRLNDGLTWERVLAEYESLLNVWAIER